MACCKVNFTLIITCASVMCISDDVTQFAVDCTFYHPVVTFVFRSYLIKEHSYRHCINVSCGGMFFRCLGFGSFAVTHFNTVVLTFHVWFSEIGMRPRGW
jgi:hypothetical protein